MKMLVAALPA